MQVTTVGLDLAKNIFQAHGITSDGTVAFNRALRRGQVLPFFAKLEPHLVAQRLKLTRPMVRRGARLDADKAGGKFFEERQNLATP